MSRSFKVMTQEYSETLMSQADCTSSILLLPAQDVSMTWNEVTVFAMYLKRYRDESGMSVAEVADAIGTTEGTIRFWLTGTRPPGKGNLRKLTTLFAHLGCTIDQLLGGAPPSSDHAPRDEAFGNIMGIYGVGLSEETKAAMIQMAKAGQVLAQERRKSEKDS